MSRVSTFIAVVSLCLFFPTVMSRFISDHPKSYGVLLYPDFAVLDAFGPLAFSRLPAKYNIKIHLLSESLEPVPTHTLSSNMTNLVSKVGEFILPIHTFATTPNLDVLIIPGGGGTYPSDPVRDQFVRDQYPKLQYLFSVCTGAAICARAGVLDGRNATTNKAEYSWVISQGPNVHWNPKARWVVDGNVWSSSGVEAGTDQAYAFISEVYGSDVANQIANEIEYAPHTDPSWDPFSDLYNLTSLPLVLNSQSVSLLPQASNAYAGFYKRDTTRNFGVVIYPGVSALDISGALELVHALSFKYPINITVIAESTTPVLTGSAGPHGGQRFLPTHTFANPPLVDVLIVPGAHTADLPPYSHGVTAFITKIFPSLEKLLTVSTGSLLAAKAGVLNHQRATTSKQFFNATAKYSSVQWVKQARWVVSGSQGKIYTASGTAASLDASYALLTELYGEKAAGDAANLAEYEPHTNSTWDPYSEIWSV